VNQINTQCRRVCNLGIDSATIADTQRCHKPRSCACAAWFTLYMYMLSASGSYIVNLGESIKFLSVSVRLQRLPFARAIYELGYIRNVLRDRELCAYGHNVECVCEREKSCTAENFLTRVFQQILVCSAYSRVAFAHRLWRSAALITLSKSHNFCHGQC
jgi:hypothetical protein